MKDAQQKVREFILKAAQECPAVPTAPSRSLHEFRVKLIEEELGELWQASDMNEAADAIGDLLYVVIGTAVAYGIDIAPIFDEIHRSNMSKFIDGYKRDDGKWIKGPSYSPANLKPILEAQLTPNTIE